MHCIRCQPQLRWVKYMLFWLTYWNTLGNEDFAFSQNVWYFSIICCFTVHYGFYPFYPLLDAAGLQSWSWRVSWWPWDTAASSLRITSGCSSDVIVPWFLFKQPLPSSLPADSAHLSPLGHGCLSRSSLCHDLTLHGYLTIPYIS